MRAAPLIVGAIIAVPLIIIGLVWDAGPACSYPNAASPIDSARLAARGVPPQCTADLTWLTTTMLIVGIIVAIAAIALAFRSRES
jgi:hypothetical protein